MRQDAAFARGSNEGRARRSARLRWMGGGPAALFVAALLVRAGPWREVLGPEAVVPVGNDAFYHLRRITYAVFRHPEFLDFDRYLHFPHGAKPIWPPLFDASVAALLRPFVPPLKAGGIERVEVLAMWIPPLLGAIAVATTAWLARRHFGQAVGLLAGGTLCLLSGHFWYSQIGFLDNHAAMAALAALLLGAGLSLIACETQDRMPATLGWSLWTGALSALCLLVWPGGLLHVALVHVGLLAFLLGRPRRDRAVRLAALLAGGYALAFLVVAPAGFSSDWPQWSALSPVVLSRFQPWLFGVAVFVCGGCAVSWRSRRLGASRARRALAFLGLALAAAGGSAALLPELLDGAGDAWRWLAKEESFQSRVSESLPLFSDGGFFSLRIAAVRLSLFVFVLPIAAIWIIWRYRHRPELARVVLLAFFALGLFGVTLLQKRFFNSASIGLSLVLAISAREAWNQVGPGGWRRPALALAVALCLLPTLEPYPRFAANELRALRGEKLHVTGAFGASQAALETAIWLRTETPRTRGWLRAEQLPEYGVLAPWHLGHVIQYVGRRPTIVDNFGDDLGEEAFAFADRFYLSPEREVAEAAAERGVRYVVVQRGSSFLSRPAGPDSLAHALVDGEPLERHRLRFESKGLRWIDEQAEPIYKVYELVRGAEIVGRAAPGASIELRAGVSTNRGRRFFYERRIRAGSDGSWRVRVPYATVGGPEALRVAPRYRVKCGDEVRGVVVSEDAVRRGAVVVGPALCTQRP